ncbi:MAG TPA: M12 family metallo-peptidase, partial [Thermoguttaceae bacterium]
MSSSLRLPLIFVLFLFALGLCSLRVEAGVAVLANNTDAPVRFEIIDSDGKQQGFMLDRSDVIPIACPEQIGIVFGSNGTQRRYLLRSNTINYIAKADNSLDLRTLLLPAPPDEDRNLPPPKPRNIPHAILTIPVKILADDDQPAVQRVWEREFRDRIDTASTIFEHHCGIRFEVKAVETWTSNNRITEFDESLREFETKVNPAPAKVAIGFTSQYAIPHGFTHLGGTRGPIHSHILIREWSQHVTRSERLEILIHELGHLYGASHSADPASVMRPRLGDRRSNSASFRIGFDPLNTLA